MAYKLLDAARDRWWRFNGHQLVGDVPAGATFKECIKVTDDQTTRTDEKVAARCFTFSATTLRIAALVFAGIAWSTR